MYSSHKIQEDSVDYEKQNQQAFVKNINLLSFKQRSLLHVSATYCGHPQRGDL